MLFQMAKYRVAVIPGDGIGPEVVGATLHVLRSMGMDMDFATINVGYARWKKTGHQITDDDVEAVKACNACLKGPTMTPLGPETFKSVAVTLRQTLDLYANVRIFKSRAGAKAVHDGVDFIIVRENTEGVYRGIEYRVGDSALGMRIVTLKASERIARFAFRLAKKEGKKKVTIVHKANICKETCGLFRNACLKVAEDFPDIKAEEMLVDAAALRIVRDPWYFDVIVTTNLFGDILSDEAAGIVGGLGMVPSANIGDGYALFEPVHGTAPDIAGKGIANPIATILSASLMLKYLGEDTVARRIEEAVDEVLREGKTLTPDLGGSSSTQAMAEAIVDKVGA
jgi:isopropylmalate/isohomocitrate dehydrogenase-like protein